MGSEAKHSGKPRTIDVDTASRIIYRELLFQKFHK